jgi:hypothetical protein
MAQLMPHLLAVTPEGKRRVQTLRNKRLAQRGNCYSKKHTFGVFYIRASPRFFCGPLVGIGTVLDIKILTEEGPSMRFGRDGAAHSRLYRSFNRSNQRPKNHPKPSDEV